MAANKINIPYQQVWDVAKQFKQKSQESAQMVQQLTGAVNGIAWEGMAAERFYNDFTNWQKQMNTYVQVLDNIGNELNKIANVIHDAETSVANQR